MLQLHQDSIIIKLGQFIPLCQHNCHWVLAAPCLNRREIFNALWFVHYVYTLSHISHGSFQLYESLWQRHMTSAQALQGTRILF